MGQCLGLVEYIGRPDRAGHPIVTKLHALIIALVCLLAHGVADAGERLRIGIGKDYPPFYYADIHGKMRGFEVDLAEAICAEIDAKCMFVPTERWDHLIPGLLAGRYDVLMASVSITDPRKRHLLFSRKYYSSRASMLAMKDIPIDPRRPETMSGRIVGVESGTTHESFAQQHFAPMNVKVAPYVTLSEALLDLQRGEVDAVIGDKIALLGALQNQDRGRCCQLIGDDLDDPAILGQSVGAAFRQKDLALKRRFDDAIERIIVSGEYMRINDRHFPFDVY